MSEHGHKIDGTIRRGMSDSTTIWIAAALFIAAFTQAVTGFGSALVGMPLLAQAIGVTIGAPLLALVSLPMNLILLVSQRRGFDLRAVWRVALASLLAIPLGIAAPSVVNERAIVVGLGMILVAYGLYALLAPRLPTLAGKAWAYVFGFFSGLLAGAYNVGGPPLVIYAACREWEAQEFRSNLQGLFFLMNIVVVLGHTWNGTLNQAVLDYLPVALAALLAGIGAGLVLDRYIPEKIFHKLVLVMLVVLGGRLILG